MESFVEELLKVFCKGKFKRNEHLLVPILTKIFVERAVAEVGLVLDNLHFMKHGHGVSSGLEVQREKGNHRNSCLDDLLNGFFIFIRGWWGFYWGFGNWITNTFGIDSYASFFTCNSTVE